MTPPFSFYRPKNRLGLPGQDQAPDMFTLNHDAIDRADATSAQADQINAFEQGPPPAAPTPHQSFGQRLLRVLPDAIGQGLATINPDERGVGAFLGGLGRGYVGQQDRAKEDAATAQRSQMLQQQQEVERQRLAMQMRAQLMGQATDNARLTIDQQRLGIERQRAAADETRAARPVAGEIPEWQKQGYPDFEAWRRDRLSISRAGVNPADRGAVTPKDIFGEKTRLMAPHWGPDATGAIKLMPGLSAADADRVVSQAAGTYQAPPAASTFGGGLAPFVRQGAASGGAQVHHQGPNGPDSQPAANSRAGRQEGAAPKSAADRWEELVAGGMDKAEATAKVNAEGLR